MSVTLNWKAIVSGNPPFGVQKCPTSGDDRLLGRKATGR
jgi:hypothetical protein